MRTLEDAEEVVSHLRLPEKAALLHALAVEVGEVFPGIEALEGVCGGEACLVRTRIPVWLLVQARRLGAGEADLLRAYPALRAEDLGHAWSYYRVHRDEIDADIQANEEA